MSDEADPNDKLWLSRSMAFAAGLIIFYVLSIGPVALIGKKTGFPDVQTGRRIYYPLVLLHDHTILKKPLEEYLALWGAN